MKPKLLILLLFASTGIHPQQAEQQQPIKSKFTYVLQKELIGDSVVTYYMSFAIKQNGKFKTWETEKIYVK